MSRTRRKKKCKQVITSALVAGMALTSAAMPVLAAEKANPIAAVEADYGYYVDTYEKNDGNLGAPAFTLDNPSIGVLSEMLKYYTPGTAWNNGTILNQAIHDMNMNQTKAIVTNSTDVQKKLAYLDDRRHQSYSMISGLGVYTDEFIKGTNAGTSISDEIPADATEKSYSDAGNEKGSWAEVDSTYGDVINLVNTVRNGAASSNQAKAYYKYMRPFRWLIEDNTEGWTKKADAANQDNIVIPTLKPCIKAKEKVDSDGGFNSGHTNAAYLAAISMAYAVPEQYQQEILRASELGNSRIVAGMHSCLDVIGGRMTATAIAASNLYDSKNADVKAKAIAAGQKLTATKEAPEYTYEQYQADKATYLEKMTYGIKESNADTTKAMVVPMGAEVLLESRLPYLDADQRRYVLYSTGISSGYAITDDKEGWGRLNLFEAASGYGAFVTDVTVNMDASKGGFNASDNWMNDIDGTGSLTKAGTGTLKLSGNNTYSGNTTVKDGSIVANSRSAFGTGNVTNESTIVENTTSAVNLAGSYKQDDDAVLELTISNAEDVLNIAGNADLNGTLVLNFDNYVPEDGFKAVNYASASSQFKEVKVNGLEGKNVEYTENGISIIDNAQPDDGEKSPQTGDSANVFAMFTMMLSAALAGAGVLFAKVFGKKEIRR